MTEIMRLNNSMFKFLEIAVLKKEEFTRYVTLYLFTQVLNIFY